MLHPERLQQLAHVQARPCVSIYSPTGAAGPDSMADPVRLKNGIREAERRLAELGFDARVIDPLLAPARRFLNELSPTIYADGTIAILLGGEVAEIFHSPLRIEAQVFVSDRLHLKPLLPVLTENATFYVLAASQQNIRLLECTRFSQREVELPPDVPQRAAEVEPPSELEGTLQYHTARPKISAQGVGGEVVYHGQGQEQRVRQHLLFHFLREVSKGITELLDGRSPLVFAGVDELFAIYREANIYPHLAEVNISGNPEHVRAEELGRRGWEIVAAAMEQRLVEVHEAFGTLSARDRATADVKAAVLAAYYGMAGTIIGASDRIIWGRMSDSGDDVEYHAQPEPWDYDLIDYAAMQALEHSGTALIVPGDRVPGNGHGLAALLRY